MANWLNQLQSLLGPASCNTATTTSRKSTTRRTSPKRPLPGSSPPWTDTSTTAKRPTISMSLPGTCAGTITVGSRNSPLPTCPNRRTARWTPWTPAWTCRTPFASCRRRFSPPRCSFSSRNASSGKSPKFWASVSPWSSTVSAKPESSWRSFSERRRLDETSPL